MGIPRKLHLPDLLEKKSFFLLGPRSTGKSTLIRDQLTNNAFMIDLLESDTYLRLSANPQDLEGMILANPEKKIVVIDEIQKIPQLLNEVHRLIEKHGTRFLLTGSSARKLKGDVSNLLAGRAWVAHLFPLSWSEIPSFDLERYLRVGGLPHVYLSTEPEEELRAYLRTYLYEEIRAEGIVRKIPSFARFLQLASLSSGQLLNFAEIASDCGIPAATIREYYFILEDTLIGQLLPPWTKSKKRKAIQTAKFYFFDVGVNNSLIKVKELERHSNLYGNAFEHFIGMELRAYLGYTRTGDDLAFWRSVNEQEVDYIVGDHTAIEVKAAQKVIPRHLRGLKALYEEKIVKRYFLISQDPIAAVRNNIHCLPWQTFLEQLWAGKIF